jgi:hypothetical protein
MRKIMILGMGIGMLTEAVVRAAIESTEELLIVVNPEGTETTMGSERERGIQIHVAPPEKERYILTAVPQLKARDMFFPKPKPTYVKNQLSYKNRRKK